MKITFNDTQRKPFQCLQHVMLEEGKKLEALVVAEKGRGRDFFDKIEGEFCTQLDFEEVLLDMIKSRSIAVLFISTLEEVGKLFTKRREDAKLNSGAQRRKSVHL